VRSVKTSWREGISDELAACVERVVRGFVSPTDFAGLWVPFRFTTDDGCDADPAFDL
jgi:hypothetical protein